VPEVAISILVATCGRPTLDGTLESIRPQLRSGDDIIVYYDTSGNAGDTARNRMMPQARGTHLMFVDDDDELRPGALDAIRAFARDNPGRIGIFRINLGLYGPVPQGPVDLAHTATAMYVIPNVPGKLGRWGSPPDALPGRRGDYGFIVETVGFQGEPVWCEYVIQEIRPEKSRRKRLRYRIALRTRLKRVLLANGLGIRCGRLCSREGGPAACGRRLVQGPMTLRSHLPASARRLIRDLWQSSRELPRTPDRHGVSPIPGRYLIKGGYVERAQPTYDDLSLVGTNWQASVYARASELAASAGVSQVVDVGCGDCRNRRLLGDLKVVGLDYGANLQAARTAYPDVTLVEVDLEDDSDVLPTSVAGSIVVCADVIEHLRRPERLLAKLRRALIDGASTVLLSTPDRDCWWGQDHFGPPPNTGHVREWNREEFAALLGAERLVGTTEMVQSNDRGPERKTILAVLTEAY
jgi:2-polyprenyl-3-methyl-5-hydroxy-6-metoxy-1,4-benzoquinol methylase